MKTTQFTKRRLLSVALTVLILIAAMLPACKSGDQKKAEEQTAKPTGEISYYEDTTGYAVSDTVTDTVRLTVSFTDASNKQRQGNIYIELRPDVAPITVANFKELVASGFYNGLTFHRIYPGFMIQGGDPDGNGTGGSGKNIVGEFSENGHPNSLSHLRGTVSMARSNDKNSASSQFFIVQKDSAAASLDGKYAAFGTVVYGMNIVDGIMNVKKNPNGSNENGTLTTPSYPVTILSAVFVTKPAD